MNTGPLQGRDQLAATARDALQIACAGSLDRIPDYYSDRFTDHVNGRVYHGHDGARDSVSFYMKLLTDLRFEVREQLVDGDKVASRFTMSGSYHGRGIALDGIVISTIVDGKIVEDWAFSDTLTLLTQLGPRRVLQLGVDLLTRRITIPSSRNNPTMTGADRALSRPFAR